MSSSRGKGKSSSKDVGRNDSRPYPGHQGHHQGPYTNTRNQCHHDSYDPRHQGHHDPYDDPRYQGHHGPSRGKAQGQGMLYSGATSAGMPPDHRDTHLPMHGQGGHSYHSSGMNPQFTTQESLHRSLQASTQMLYDVFDYTIGMLEELEKHERHPKPNSGLLSHLIPVERKKPFDEVTTGIEVELQCLSIEMRYMPPEVIKDSKKELVTQLLKWAATRDGLEYGPIDHYCKNVLEVLLFGKHGQLPPLERPVPEITEKDVNKAMFQLAKGRHIGEQQDKDFHDNPNKKAELKPKRHGELRAGAVRLVQNGGKELYEELTKYLPDEPMEYR